GLTPRRESAAMPESPEVQVLAEFLDARLRGRVVASVDVVEFRAVKTRARPPESVVGARVRGVARHGKHLDVTLDGAHLVVSLGRHGWVRWRDSADAGSWVSVGLAVVDDPAEVPAVAGLGPDPADASFTRADL